LKHFGTFIRLLEPWLHLEEAAKIRRLQRHIPSVSDSVMSSFGSDANDRREEIDHEISLATDWDQAELDS
jgi:hypothetical protein